MNNTPAVPGQPPLPGSPGTSHLPPPSASRAAPPTASPPPPPPPPPAPPAPPPPPPPPAPQPPAPSRAPVSAALDDDLAALLSQITDDEDTAIPSVGAPLTKPTDVERPQLAAAAHIESEGGLEFDPELASFGARFVGLVLDDLVTLLFLLPGFALAITGSTPLIVLGLLAMAVGFGAATVLYARAVAAGGQWIGNRATSTKVVDARHGKTVPAGEAGLRFVLRFAVSSILLFGYLMALGDSQRRSFHDKIAGTVVTRPPRASWSIDDEAAGA